MEPQVNIMMTRARKTNVSESVPFADGIPVYCAHDAIVEAAALVPNPRNPNTHSD